MQTFIEIETDESVSVLRLNKPPVNALDKTSLRELTEAVTQIERDPGVKAVIITSAIKDVFCAGGDLKYWRQIHNGNEVSRAGREAFSKIEHLPKPTIAAINGHVIGDGLSLALACDIRIASEAATFRMPEAAYGFIPGWSSIQRLAAFTGRGNSSFLLMTGKLMEADRAQTIGLVNEVVPPDILTEAVMDLAHRITVLSPVSLRAMKCVLLGGDERVCFESVWGGADWKEGIDALINKRMPVFSPDSGGGVCCSIAHVNSTMGIE
jgi:enoyl-CoA hydratase